MYITFIPFIISSTILLLNNIFYDYFQIHIFSLDSAKLQAHIIPLPS